MNPYTASPAMRFGYYLGMTLPFVLLIFGVVAIVKAFTRKTVGWIVAGCIGGALWGLILVAFAVGVVKGISNVRQNMGMPAAFDPSLHAPDSGSQIIHGQELGYTLSLPASWTVKYREENFDVIARSKSLYIGVIAEEADLGSPQKIADLSRQRLRTMATEVRWSDPAPLTLAGHDWLQFTVACSVQGLPVTYQFYVYSGKEGTYQIIGWTAQNLYARDAGVMREVMKTFAFPKAAPTPPSAQPSFSEPPLKPADAEPDRKAPAELTPL